ncbi:type II CAAX prenyl endopeptidase Rce1 family protein [Streptomyces sp. NPDC050418]|uniref:CPBP family glutamic-type intramembrane protease n=1 Tax=Streptomyces sp. NPDC050418 TaxID=3365612 RepID=UPI0037AF02F4
MTISPEFGTAGAAVTAAVLAYLAVADPLIGRRMYAALQRRRPTDPRALTRYYTVVTAAWWLLAAVAAAGFLLAEDVSAADVGLTAPETPWYAALLCALLITGAVVTGRTMRRLHAEDRNVPGMSTIEAMLPRTAAERRYATAAAVTDGICAEFVYRGLFIAFGVGVLGLHLYLAAALALVVYALAGLYQGRRGVIAFALFGAIGTLFYLTTGSLLVPVVFHVAMTVRDLAFIPVPPRTQQTDAAAAL